MAAAGEYAAASRQAYDSIRLLTDRYERGIAGGKWRGIISPSPRNLPVFAAPVFGEMPREQLSPVVWADGAGRPAGADTTELPRLVRSAANGAAVNVFAASDVRIESLPAWLEAEVRVCTPSHRRILFRADRSRCRRAEEGLCSVLAGGCRYVFRVRYADDRREPGAAMTDGVAAVAGAGYASVRGWVSEIDGLGQSGRAVRLAEGSRAEYLLRCDAAGEADVVACFLPQHPAAAKTLRFRLTVDGGEQGVFDIRETFGEEPWKVNVLRNQARRGVRLHLSEGVHRIGIEPVDEAMLLDGVFIGRLRRNPYVLPGFSR